MEKKITLQDVLGAVNALSGKFDALDRRADSIERRLNRLETTTQEIQKSVEGLQDEMRGIHKVLDRFDWRTTRLEEHLDLQIKGSAG